MLNVARDGDPHARLDDDDLDDDTLTWFWHERGLPPQAAALLLVEDAWAAVSYDPARVDRPALVDRVRRWARRQAAAGSTYRILWSHEVVALGATLVILWAAP